MTHAARVSDAVACPHGVAGDRWSCWRPPPLPIRPTRQRVCRARDAERTRCPRVRGRERSNCREQDCGRSRSLRHETVRQALRLGRPDRNPIRLVTQSAPDGHRALGRQRIAANASIALDVVAYASTGLSVGGLLCYPNDGASHSTVIHVPGGSGGAFNGVAGDMVQTCIDWAALHGRTAFIPSLRGNDGGEGHTELCLGEGNDVVAAAVMLRSAGGDGRRDRLGSSAARLAAAWRYAPRHSFHRWRPWWRSCHRRPGST